MSHQNAIQVPIQNTHVSEELLNSVVSLRLPAL